MEIPNIDYDGVPLDEEEQDFEAEIVEIPELVLLTVDEAREVAGLLASASAEYWTQPAFDAVQRWIKRLRGEEAEE